MDVRWGEQKEVDRKRRKTIDDIMVAGGRELIDTLWNVNGKQVTKGRMLDFRINRYIMECKRQNIIVKNKLLKMFIILQKTKREFSVVQLPR